MTERMHERRLFRAQSVTARDFVVFNWIGQPIDHFAPYAEAYHRAAQKLVRDCGTAGALRDFEAAPVLFLYRHAFELYLKAFVLTGSKILQLAGRQGMAPDRLLSSHRLSEFLPWVEATIQEVSWSWDLGADELRTRRDFVTLLHELEEVDPGSYTFRYPTNKGGAAVLPRHFSFNVSAFAQRLDPLLDAFAGGVMGLQEYWSAAAEAAYEARQHREDGV